MNPLLASLIFWCGIAGLFYLDRGDSPRPSKALWLPTFYLLIIGSRPVSVWLNITPSAGTDVQLEGSPIDAAFFGVLLVAAIVVLIRRQRRTRTFLAANWPILIYYFFCLISVTWSYHPDVAFKRWIKSFGDLAMVLVIVTDFHPVAAIERLISRVGFVLLPASVLLIKYYGYLGRGYTPDGVPMNTGVTTNKNALGCIVLVVSLCTLWHLMTLIREKTQPNRRRHLAAQGILLAFGLVLFQMADSMTATACFLLGGGLMLASRLRAVRRRPARVQLLCLAIFLSGGLVLLLGGQGDVAHALGRSSNFSGRTQIWTAVIHAVPNPIIGAGFESFWISPSAQKAQNTLAHQGWWYPEGLNEAHNGYIEVYLQLGGVGVGLILCILFSGYRRAVAAYRLNPSLGGLMLAFIIASAFYSITEAGFRMMDYMWIFLLLGIIASDGIASGAFAKSSKPIRSIANPVLGLTTEKWAATRDHVRSR